MSRSAAVVDLQDFRRRRAAREAPPSRSPQPASAGVAVPYGPVVPVPVWVVWMPVWTVA